MANIEILGHSDSQQTPPPVDHENSLINRLDGVGRASEVVGLGIGEGMVDGIKDLPNHLTQVAESVGIGYAMGAAMHFGTPGKILALGAGAVMLGDWAYNEITGGRWQKIGAAVSDAYNSNAHLQDDIQTSRQQLGSFAFDTTLAFASGGLGAKLGYANFAADGAGTSLMSKTLGTTPGEMGAAGDSALASLRGKFAGLTGQTESAAYGLSLGADVATGSSAIDAATEFLKPKKFTGLDQIKEAWANGQVEQDGTYVGLKGKLQDTVAENQVHASRIDQLTQEITGHNKELKQWQELLPQRNAVTAAEQHVEFLKNQKDVVLPQQQSLLRSLDQQLQAEARARELAKQQAESGQPHKGKPAGKPAANPQAEASADGEANTSAGDLKTQRRELSQKVRDLTAETSDEALRGARVRVADAQSALTTAQEQAPGKISEIEQMIQSKQAELTTHHEAIAALSDQTASLLDQLQARRTEILGDTSKSVPITEAQPARKLTTQLSERNGGSLRTSEQTDFRPTPRVKGASENLAETRVKPEKTEAITPELAAKQQAESTLGQAEQYIKSFQAERELRAARHQKTNIEQGKVRVPDKAKALETAEVRIAKAESEAQTAGPTKYAQTVRSLRDYANAVGNYLAKEPDSSARDAYAKQAVTNLETMMPAVDNLYKGVQGGADLPRLNLNAPFDPLKRLGDIQNHLDTRINQIDSNNLRRSSRLVSDNPVFKELSTNLNDLPSDGTLFFFNKDGELVKGPATFQGKVIGQDGVRYRADALNEDGTLTGRDGNVVTKPDGTPIKVSTTYKAIDISRWQQHGVDVNGAGIDRFKGEDVQGAVLVRPKYDSSGNPLEIRRQTRGGKPTIAKEVVGAFGEVPENVTDGMSLGNLMRTFDPEQIAARQNKQ